MLAFGVAPYPACSDSAVRARSGGRALGGGPVGLRAGPEALVGDAGAA